MAFAFVVDVFTTLTCVTFLVISRSQTPQKYENSGDAAFYLFIYLFLHHHLSFGSFSYRIAGGYS